MNLPSRPGLIDPAGRPLRAAASGVRLDAPLRASGRSGPAFEGWSPIPVSADREALPGRNTAAGRAQDIARNNPHASAGLRRKLDMVIGAGWRPSIDPDPEMLGCSPEAAARLGREIEKVWRMWAEDPMLRCDLERDLSGGQMLWVMTAERLRGGDGLGIIRYRENHHGWPFRTRLQLVDAIRLSNPQDTPDTDELRGGVRRDPETGEAIGYHIRDAHPFDVDWTSAARANRWTYVDRDEPWGRPKVLHVFAKERPGQTRGVSALVCVMAELKMLARFAEAELQSATINALFAATITSDMDPGVLAERMGDAGAADMTELRTAYYDTLSPTFGGSRIQHLFPGDDLKFNVSPRQTSVFDAFQTAFLRSVATGLDLSYEQLAMDWSKTNYSSMRAALLEVWRSVYRERDIVARRAAWPLLMALVEDGIDAGLITPPAGAPDLYAMPAAWLRGSWIGPARGWVDPVKEIAGAALAIETGLSDYEEEAAAQGREFEVTLSRLQRQRELWSAAGMTPPALAAMMALANQQDSREAGL